MLEVNESKTPGENREKPVEEVRDAYFFYSSMHSFFSGISLIPSHAHDSPKILSQIAVVETELARIKQVTDGWKESAVIMGGWLS